MISEGGPGGVAARRSVAEPEKLRTPWLVGRSVGAGHERKSKGGPDRRRGWGVVGFATSNKLSQNGESSSGHLPRDKVEPAMSFGSGIDTRAGSCDCWRSALWIPSRMPTVGHSETVATMSGCNMPDLASAPTEARLPNLSLSVTGRPNAAWRAEKVPASSHRGFDGDGCGRSQRRPRHLVTKGGDSEQRRRPTQTHERTSVPERLLSSKRCAIRTFWRKLTSLRAADEAEVVLIPPYSPRPPPAHGGSPDAPSRHRAACPGTRPGGRCGSGTGCRRAPGGARPAGRRGRRWR